MNATQSRMPKIGTSDIGSSYNSPGVNPVFQGRLVEAVSPKLYATRTIQFNCDTELCDRKITEFRSVMADAEKLKDMLSLVKMAHSKFELSTSYSHYYPPLSAYRHRILKNIDILQTPKFEFEVFNDNDALSRCDIKLKNLRRGYAFATVKTGMGCYGNCQEQSLFYMAHHSKKYPEDNVRLLKLVTPGDHAFVSVFKKGMDINNHETIIVDPWSGVIFKLKESEAALFNPTRSGIVLMPDNTTQYFKASQSCREDESFFDSIKKTSSKKEVIRNRIFREAANNMDTGYYRVEEGKYFQLQTLLDQLPESEREGALAIGLDKDGTLLIFFPQNADTRKREYHYTEITDALIFPESQKEALKHWMENLADDLFDNLIKEKYFSKLFNHLLPFLKNLTNFEHLTTDIKQAVAKKIFERFSAIFERIVKDGQPWFPDKLDYGERTSYFTKMTLFLSKILTYSGKEDREKAALWLYEKMATPLSGAINNNTYFDNRHRSIDFFLILANDVPEQVAKMVCSALISELRCDHGVTDCFFLGCLDKVRSAFKNNKKGFDDIVRSCLIEIQTLKRNFSYAPACKRDSIKPRCTASFVERSITERLDGVQVKYW